MEGCRVRTTTFSNTGNEIFLNADQPHLCQKWQFIALLKDRNWEGTAGEREGSHSPACLWPDPKLSVPKGMK